MIVYCPSPVGGSRPAQPGESTRDEAPRPLGAAPRAAKGERLPDNSSSGSGLSGSSAGSCSTGEATLRCCMSTGILPNAPGDGQACRGVEAGEQDGSGEQDGTGDGEAVEDTLRAMPTIGLSVFRTCRHLLCAVAATSTMRMVVSFAATSKCASPEAEMRTSHSCKPSESATSAAVKSPCQSPSMTSAMACHRSSSAARLPLPAPPRPARAVARNSFSAGAR
mmetsp:Transcript_123844/g.396440  ORF Transcript_123844/g.396440 Transcript_123844/m.396440 type:complete len:222 (+) Transcript_123844:3-668(+)